MFNNLRTNKILWSITNTLALIAAILVVIFPRMYDEVFAKQFIPGALPQDILTVFICLAVFLFIARMKEHSVKTQSIIIGIIGTYFYLYGIFTIERVYNFLYLLYASIFAMSFWSILYSLVHLKWEALRKVTISPLVVKISAVFGLIIPTLFTILWVMDLIPLMREHNRIEFLYSIYILDLCFIMPAFLITSILSLKKNALGILFLPAVYIVGVFVIFPLGLGEMVKPFYGQAAEYGYMAISFAFSALMLAVAFLHLKKTHVH